MIRVDPGSTGVSLVFHLRDSTTGLGKTGLVATSPGAAAGYSRTRGSAVPVNLVQLSGPTAAWQAGGFCEIDAVNQKGAYRVDPPDAAPAAGAAYFTFSLAFQNTIDETLLVQLDKASTNVGAGTIPLTVTVTSTIGGTPLQGARVWVTTDAAGTNVVAGTLTTDANGLCTFMLTAGTYYIWISDPGYTLTNPTTVTVS